MPSVAVVKNATMGDTLKAMRQKALEGARDPRVRRLVEVICKDIPAGDYASELLAIYYWVCTHVRYMRDIAGVEMLKGTRYIINTQSGDCDDISTLLAAMLMSAGNPVQFATVGFGRGPMSHVYVQVPTPFGAITLDPVAKRVTKEMLNRVSIKAVWPVAGGVADAGVGALAGVPAQRGGLYSVYDYTRGVYNYYSDLGFVDIPDTGRYRKPRDYGTRSGFAPESFAIKLPSSAKHIGSGVDPRGMIASLGSTLFDYTPAFGTLFPFLVGAGVGVFIYRRMRGLR